MSSLWLEFETSAILLRVADGARLCLCIGESICVTSPGVSIRVAAASPNAATVTSNNAGNTGASYMHFNNLKVQIVSILLHGTKF